MIDVYKRNINNLSKGRWETTGQTALKIVSTADCLEILIKFNFNVNDLSFLEMKIHSLFDLGIIYTENRTHRCVTQTKLFILPSIPL